MCQALQAHQIALAQTTIEHLARRDVHENGLRAVLAMRTGLPHDNGQLTNGLYVLMNLLFKRLRYTFLCSTRYLQAARVRAWHSLHYTSILPLEDNNPNPDVTLTRIVYIIPLVDIINLTSISDREGVHFARSLELLDCAWFFIWKAIAQSASFAYYYSFNHTD